MKTLAFSFLLFSSLSLAQVTGSGSAPGVGGAGPNTPGAGSGDTSVMGGGTPGGPGIDTYGIEEPTEEELEKMQQQEEDKEAREREKKKKQQNSF